MQLTKCKPKKNLRRGNTLSLMLIALPGVLYLLINNYLPMSGLFLAFKNYSFPKGIWGSPWYGLKNFRFLFISNDAWIITRNTICYNFVFIVLGTAVSVFFAIMLYELGETARAKTYQSVLLFPHLISWVVSAYLVYALLNPTTGFVNKTLLPMFGAEGIDWYTSSEYWPVILTITYLWKHAGYNAIVYMASISGIDKGIFEAAEIDGANKVQQIFRITLPMLKPTITIMVLMAIGRVFYSDFGLFYQIPMDSGQLYDVTQTIDTYVYRGLMQNANVSLSAAAGFYQSVCGFLLVLGANKLVRIFDSDNTLF
jgi:putative aldouronate transport system permease protein